MDEKDTPEPEKIEAPQPSKVQVPFTLQQLQDITEQVSIPGSLNGVSVKSIDPSMGKTINASIGQWADWDSYGALGAAQTHQFPKYFDITGQEYVNYGYSYGPHGGMLCTCDECHQFNKEFADREEQMMLLNKIHHEGMKTFSHYFMRSYSGPTEQIDISTAIQIMLNFTKKQIADYQQKMVKKVHKIQETHAQMLRGAYKSKAELEKLKATMEKLKAPQPEGRLFKVDGEEAA